jgi:hypothetical protein
MRKTKWFKLGLLSLLAVVIISGYGGSCATPGNDTSSGSSDSKAPSVTTNPATNVTPDSATLNGTVNPNGISTSVYFKYGTTYTCSNSTLPQSHGRGTDNVDFSANLTELSEKTIYNFRAATTNAAGTTYGTKQTFTTLERNKPPVLAQIDNKTVEIGTLLTFTISATDPDVGNTLTYSYANLPTGASFDTTTRTFSWRPTNSGNYNVTFIVTDNGMPSLSDSETITISVGNVDRPPSLTFPGDKTVNENELLTFTLSAVDSDEDPIVYSMTPTPKGATLDSSAGVFTWKPTYEQSGSYVVTFIATANGLSNSKTINITVNNINRAPVLAAIGDKSVNERQLLTFSISASDLDLDQITYSMTPTPQGATLDLNTGAFLWTPTYAQSGNYDVTFITTDNVSQNLSDSEAITITVQNIPAPPNVSTNPATNVTCNSATLQGTVNPNSSNTTAYFEYGITSTPPSYTFTTTPQDVGSGGNDVIFTANLNGLVLATTYNFRLVAINSDGITYGGNQIFTTPLSLSWTQTSNPSSGNDSAYSITSDNNYIYIVGSDASPANCQWCIEKRDKTTGALDANFGTNGAVVSNPSSGNDVAYSITSDNNYLYIVGVDLSPAAIPGNLSGDAQWRIEKRDKIAGVLDANFGTGGVITNNPGRGEDRPNSIIVDNNYLYIGGYDTIPGDHQWRIEKRDKTTGALDANFGTGGVITLNPGSCSDGVTSITADNTYLYIAGYDSSPGGSIPGNAQWRIEKRDKTTGVLVANFGTNGVVVSNPSGSSSGIDYPYSIITDNVYLYIAGSDYSTTNCTSQWRIEKRDKITGALDANFGTNGVVVSNPSTSTSDIPYSIITDNNYLYIGGYDTIPGNPQWRIEKRDKIAGALDVNFGTNGAVVSNPSSKPDIAYYLIADNTHLYITGYDYSPGNYEWRIEKRDKTTGQ